MRISKTLVLKVAWIIIAAVVLVWALWKLKTGQLTDALKYEVGLAHLILMSALSFPLGPVVLFVLDRVINLAQPSLFADGGSRSEVILVWISCVAGGYVQWFIVVPTVYGKVRKRLQRDRVQ
jgi:nitrogen fixation-related uncharacterized protein